MNQQNKTDFHIYCWPSWICLCYSKPHRLLFTNGTFNGVFNLLITTPAWWITKQEHSGLTCLTCPANCAVAGDKSEPGRWFLSLPQLTEETLAVARTVAQVHNDVSRWRYCTSLINSIESEGPKCIKM